MKDLFRQVLAFIRALTFMTAIVFFFLTALPFYPFIERYPFKVRKIICAIIGFYARLALWFMGIHVTLEGEGKEDGGHYLIVSNHLSYTDVLAICAYYPACFVTSVEIKNTPFLGQICKLGGCLFVERRNKSQLGKEVKEITDALKHGLSVVIFPEATSTNGEDILRFKRALFKASVDSGVPVKPVTVNYRSLDGRVVQRKNRDEVFWYGDMTLHDHIWGVFKIKKIKVDLYLSHPIPVKGQNWDITDLANEAHRIVSSHYKRILT